MKSHSTLIPPLVLALQIITTATFLPATALSQEPELELLQPQITEYQMSEKRNIVNFGMSVALIQLGTGSLLGIGPTFGFEYLVLPKWSVYPSLTLALDVGTQGYLYSGFNGALRYSIFGSALEKSDAVTQNKWPVVRSQTLKSPRMTANIGIEQLFLNGTRAVYPATGFSLGSSYMTPFAGAWTEWTLRVALLKAGNQDAMAVMLESVINLDF